MTEPFYAPRFEILLSGVTMAADLTEQVMSLSVETDLDMAGTFSLVLRNPDNVLLDSALLDIGKNVEVHLGYGADLIPAFLGEVAAVEPSFPQDSPPTIQVTGYDKSYKLRRNRPTPTTYSSTTDSLIAARIALENGLLPVVDPTPELPEDLTQKESDFAFLKARAQRYHFDVYVEWDRLHFQFPRPAFAAHVLEWGRNLSSFTARISGAGLTGLEVIRGYNQELAQSIYAAVLAVDLDSASLLERLGGSITDLLTSLVHSEFREHSVSNPLDARELATALLADLLEGLYEGQGSCVGLPALAAGQYVEIRGVGKRFSGTYRVRKVTHRLDSSGMRTDFVISQSGQSSLVGILRENVVETPSPKQEQKFFGVLVGEVVDNHELAAVPPKVPLCRVKVQFADLSDNVVTKWAPCVQPAAGADSGFYALPDKGDQVLVAFKSGNFGEPYVLGSLWHAKARPPERNEDGANTRRVIKTKGGHTIAFDDSTQGKSLTLRDSAGSEVVMNSTNGAVSLTAHGALTISAKDDISISSTSGTVTLKAASGPTAIAISTSGVDVS
ncbi:MAG: phage baseplate assembly protein V [Humibacillus sp.]|uniref:phage baseplate assembly protein V n=1 Tax=Intrasporangium sp. TaxID=1925024 RepID=UPI00264812A0|nr:phage baseplate assembly protein V [Intrasporangium sp.]MDN5768111.1 phage baseplate assembly protein V [Humibacillus sp.]MDN5778926.1 phage baseplate assembly protein V [Humibacillus sp.]MDN5795387.1 phage baseplate assembly protein V [Intrasporangium sp.]